MSQEFPEIGVVIIGVNVAGCIADCIRSVRASDYPAELVEVVYVDGGSRDNSVEIARSFSGVAVLELNDPHPTPGRGRNEGWKYLSSPLIQFLDADTLLNPGWFRDSIGALDGDTIAVCGHRRERYPDRNAFHMLTEMEWRYETGPCRYFGGDVLIRREGLLATGGFDEGLVAGEDPELSYRLRQQGWCIMRIDLAMTIHDINMLTWGQYARRAFRSGYAYAEIGLRFRGNQEKLWLRELVRVVIKGALPPIFILSGIMSGKALLGLILGLAILSRPFLRIRRFRTESAPSWRHAVLYSCHSALVVFPQFLGAMRYLWGRLAAKPLRNKGIQQEQA